MLPLEHCQLCDAETGRAGRADDSIYLEIPNGDEVGPLCESCYGAFGKAMSACKTELVEAQNTSTNKQMVGAEPPQIISLCVGCIKECSRRSEIPSCPVTICVMRQAK